MFCIVLCRSRCCWHTYINDIQWFHRERDNYSPSRKHKFSGCRLSIRILLVAKWEQRGRETFASSSMIMLYIPTRFVFCNHIWNEAANLWLIQQFVQNANWCWCSFLLDNIEIVAHCIFFWLFGKMYLIKSYRCRFVVRAN